MAHIALSCGVRFKARPGANVPGTEIPWTTLTENSLVFPYLDGCYIFPFDLIWKSVEEEVDMEKFVASCGSLVKNLNVENLFMPYLSICHLPIYNLGIRFESFFVSSLAVKYYLHSKVYQSGATDFTKVYAIGGAESDSAKSLLAPYRVDFSEGIDVPVQEAFVDSPSLPMKSVIHNLRSQTAHHDIILPTMKDGKRENVPISVKASFKLPGNKDVDDQLRISKKLKDSDTRAPLLIWLYLDSYDKEAKHIAKNVAFLNSSGCCNGLALDKFVMLKRMRLKEAENQRQMP